MRDEREVLATCVDNGENDAPIPGVDNSQLETACLKLAELPEALAIVQAARRGASDSNRHSRASPGGKGKSRQPFGRQRVPYSARDQRQSDDRPAQVVGRTQRPRPQPQQRRGTDLQAKLDKRKARSVCHACGQTGHWAGDPQCPGRPVMSPERYAGLLKLESSPDPPASRLRPRHTSLVPKSSRSKLVSTLQMCLSLCSNNICGQLKSDRNSTTDVFDSDKRVVLQTARDATWQDPLTRLGLSVTPQDEQPEAPTALQDQLWRRMRKGFFINCAQVWNVHELWLITAFIHLVCDLVCG